MSNNNLRTGLKSLSLLLEVFPLWQSETSFSINYNPNIFASLTHNHLSGGPYIQNKIQMLSFLVLQSYLTNIANVGLCHFLNIIIVTVQTSVKLSLCIRYTCISLHLCFILLYKVDFISISYIFYNFSYIFYI